MAMKAGWQPDPTRRHQLRYWSGSEWTEHVADNGAQSTDAFEEPAVSAPADFEAMNAEVSVVDEEGVDAIEDEGGTEEADAGGPRLKKFSVTYTNYLGGHPIREKKHNGGVLRFDTDGVHMRGLRELFVIPWASVTELAVEGSEEVQKRVTATRLVMLGVFAFAAKKKGPKTAFVTVGTADGEAIFECTKTGPHEIQAKLTSAIAWIREQRSTTIGHSVAGAVAVPAFAPADTQRGDVLDQIKRLSELHAAGALSDEEFNNKKTELLKRL